MWRDADIKLNDTINYLSNGDELMKNVFVELSRGSTVISIIKDVKTRNGRLNLKPKQAEKFSRRRCNRMVKLLIKERKRIKDDFVLVDYEVDSNKLNYTIEMKKTEEADHILRTMRKIKKNKKIALSKIN